MGFRDDYGAQVARAAALEEQLAQEREKAEQISSEREHAEREAERLRAEVARLQKAAPPPKGPDPWPVLEPQQQTASSTTSLEQMRGVMIVASALLGISTIALTWATPWETDTPLYDSIERIVYTTMSVFLVVLCGAYLRWRSFARVGLLFWGGAGVLVEMVDTIAERALGQPSSILLSLIFFAFPVLVLVLFQKRIDS